MSRKSVGEADVYQLYCTEIVSLLLAREPIWTCRRWFRTNYQIGFQLISETDPKRNDKWPARIPATPPAGMRQLLRTCLFTAPKTYISVESFYCRFLVVYNLKITKYNNLKWKLKFENLYLVSCTRRTHIFFINKMNNHQALITIITITFKSKADWKHTCDYITPVALSAAVCGTEFVHHRNNNMNLMNFIKHEILRKS